MSKSTTTQGDHVLSRIRTRSGANLTEVDNTSSGALAGLPDFTYSEGVWEKCIDEVHRGPPYKTGGGLEIVKSSIKHYPATVNVRYNSSTHISGKMLCRLLAQWVPTPGYDDSQVRDFHNSGLAGSQTSAWKKARPGKAGANIAQMVGEMGRIPKLPFNNKNKPSGNRAEQYQAGVRSYADYGGEYLNVVFGWLPFLRDLRDFVEETAKLDEHLRQLARDNGRPVRRRVSLPTQNLEQYPPSTNNALFAYLWPYPHSFYYSNVNKGSQTITRELRKKRWFSARFRYWVPDLPKRSTQLRKALALYGANITPSLVWELTPWSWLIDWHSNVGDILSNLSDNAADNLVADYAYFMQHSQRSYKVDETVEWFDGSGASASAEVIFEIKQRLKADPYGFDIAFDDYSNRQMGILGALGISRSGF